MYQVERAALVVHFPTGYLFPWKKDKSVVKAIFAGLDCAESMIDGRKQDKEEE